MLFFSFVGWLLFSCMMMSFIEHQVHARMMHRKFFLAKRFAVFEKMFTSHAVLHHGTYAIEFSDEPVPPGEDKGIRLSVFEGVVESIFIAFVLCFISPIAAVAFVIVVAFHHTVWNLIHLEMHKPEGRFFSQWAVYKFLARHHMLHHNYPTKNMNVVFPFADYVLGTNAKARYSDIAQFYRAGYLRRQRNLPVSLNLI
ncbi:MAG TPA: hypothetical protein V6C89_06775 [Drouetiella sp.]|jgi:hypothetical protein